MPTASDGKEFPYTKEGIRAHREYEASLKKNNRKMAVPKSKPRHASPKNRMNTEGPPIYITGGTYT